MNETLKNFYTQKQVKRNKVKIVEKLIIKSKNNLQENVKKNEKKRSMRFLSI